MPTENIKVEKEKKKEKKNNRRLDTIKTVKNYCKEEVAETPEVEVVVVDPNNCNNNLEKVG